MTLSSGDLGAAGKLEPDQGDRCEHCLGHGPKMTMTRCCKTTHPDEDEHVDEHGTRWTIRRVAAVASPPDEGNGG